MALGHKLTRFVLDDNGTCRLAVNEEGWLNAGDASHERGNPVSNVISLLGRTHAGKSFICRELLKSLGVGLGPAAATQETMAPTSSDVVAYDGTMKNEIPVRFLDCEGEGGRVAPKELMDTTGWSPEIVREQRSVAVEKFLPRMAYVCSELVVYVTRDDLSDTRCMDEVGRFAFDQTNNAHSVKPSLIIVSNRSEYASKTIEETTEEFFEVHDPERELFSYYNEIKVQRLPVQERSPIDFQSRLDELLHAMDQMLKHKVQERKQLGIYFSEVQWLLVFNILIMEHFDPDKPIHMGEVVQKAMIPKEDFLFYQVFRFFTTANKFLEEVDGSKPEESFYLARALSVEMLAALHAADLCEWAKEIGSVIVNSPVQMKNRQEAAMKDFEKLITHMADYAPCTAVKDKKGTFIHCTSRKREHELVHCNPNVELHEKEILAQGVGTFFKTINRVKKKYNRLKHRTFPAKWEGAFQFTDCVAPAELQEMFMSTIGKLKDTSRTVNAVARVGIVRKALPVSDGSPSLQDLLGSVSDQVLLECIVCLSTHKRRDNRVGTRQLFPCGHTFCEVCINPFRSAEGDDQVSVLSGEATLCGTCPLCHSMVSQVSDIA